MMGHPQHKKMLSCKGCSKEFEAFHATFCSNNCYAKWRRKNDLAYRNNRKQYERDWKYEWSKTSKLADYQRKHLKKLRYEKPWLFMLRPVKTRAKARGYDFNLTEEWAFKRWTGRCELTGVEFSQSPGRNGPHTFAPTIDRIDNNRGYTQDNCRFVLWCVNAFKGCMTDEQVIEIASMLVVKNQKQKAAA